MLANSFDLSDQEFKLFQKIIYRETGINMSDKKKRLVIARLSKRLRALKLDNFTQYHEYLNESPYAQNEIVNLINRVTTNKTDFFREKHHFDFLSNNIFPKIIIESKNTGIKRLRVWSAGCSTGEEPYSLAMTISESFKNERGWDIKILATDLDTEVLQKANQGIYPTQSISPITREYVSRYFNRKADGYEISQQIKSMISFRKLNLMLPVFPMKKPFDVIFCRNVIIYFDHETKINLLKKFYAHLKNDGYMFIGHSESLRNMKEHFKYIKNTIYQKVG